MAPWMMNPPYPVKIYPILRKLIDLTGSGLFLPKVAQSGCVGVLQTDVIIGPCTISHQKLAIKVAIRVGAGSLLADVDCNKIS